MKINNLVIEKYKRMFVFGCSYTRYHWPTWADIIGQDVPYYENWGKPGAGNHFIFNSIMECDAKNKFTADDIILVMWSGPDREDRYINFDWICDPPQTKEKTYGKAWVKKFGQDRRGNLIRDMAYIKAIQEFLDSKNVDWANFSMYSICNIDEESILRDNYTYERDLDYFVARYVQLNRDLCDNREITEVYACDVDVLNLYREVYSNIEYSIIDVIRNGHAYKRATANFGDAHCTPLEHLQYIDAIYPDNTLSQHARKFTACWEQVVQSIVTKNIMPEEFNHPPISRL
jgi:hypothetical protein